MEEEASQEIMREGVRIGEQNAIVGKDLTMESFKTMANDAQSISLVNCTSNEWKSIASFIV